jgi:hypothetical protein
MIYARRPLLFALIRYDICMIRIIRILCSKVRRLCEGRVWLGDLIDGTLRTYELGRLAVNALEHGGLVVDVGFPNGPAMLTKELVVHVVAAHVVLDRLVVVLLARAFLLCMSYDTTPSPYAMI